MRVHELNVDVVVGDVLAREFLDHRADVGHALFGQVGKTTSGVDFPTATLRGGHERLDGQHDAAEIGKPGVRTKDGKAVDAANPLTRVHEEAVVATALDHAVSHLLLERLGDGAGPDDVLSGHEFCTVFHRQITGNAHQSTEFTEAKAEFSTAAGAALCFLEDGRNTAHVEMWDFAEGVLVTVDFLGNESNQAPAVSSRIRHF